MVSSRSHQVSPPPKQKDDNDLRLIREALSPLGYQFVQKLGEGSYANVYMVKWKSADGTIPVACKVLKAEKVLRDERNLNYITREIFVHLNAYHPDIIHTFAVFQLNEHFMILMRNAEYNNVTNFLMKHGSVKERVARFWVRQTAAALYYLHELDLIHRDMKCDNLLISINHNVKLSDFGFARFTLDQNGKPTKCLTACGSVPYAAPEVFKGQPYDGKPTDVWGLGCILFVMLNKKLPFRHSYNYTKLYQEQMKCNYIWEENIKEAVSEECIEIMARLLDPNPKSRITCEEFLESRWVKMDPSLVKPTKSEGEALEKGYERRNEIKPYKTPKFTLDTKNELKILSHDNKQWTSTKDLLKVQVNTEPTADKQNHLKLHKNDRSDSKRSHSNQSSTTKRAKQKMTEFGERVKEKFAETLGRQEKDPE